MKTSLLKLKQESNTYFDAHRQVKSFFWGDFIRLYAENQIKHSSVIIQPLRLGELSRSQVTVQLVVTYSDRIFSDFSNLDEVHSEAADVLNDFVMVLNTSPRWKDFVLGATNGNAEFFTQRSGDLVAGAAMILNVRIKSVADLCAIPATDYDFEVQPTPLPSCADVTVVNSNGEYSVQVESGGLLTLPNTPVTVTNQNGDELASVDLPSVSGGNIEVTIDPCEDATYNLDNTEGSTLSSGSIPSGDNETIIAPDGKATVKNTQNTTVATGLVPSGGSANITAPDATFSINSTQVATIPSGTSDSIQVRKQSGSDQIGSLQGQHWRIDNSAITLKDTANNTLSTTNVPATESAEIVAPDGTVTVNRDGVLFATETVQSGGTAIVNVPSDCPPPPPTVNRIGRLATKTGIITSYVSGDDGDLQTGSGASFWTLGTDGGGNNRFNAFGHNQRFTGVTGGYRGAGASANYFNVDGNETSAAAAFPNNIVIDWETFDGYKVLIWRTQTGTNTLAAWITAAAAYSVGGLDVWRMPNFNELVQLSWLRDTNFIPNLNHTAINLGNQVIVATNSTGLSGSNQHTIVRNGSGAFRWVSFNRFNTGMTAIFCRETEVQVDNLGNVTFI